MASLDAQSHSEPPIAIVLIHSSGAKILPAWQDDTQEAEGLRVLAAARPHLQAIDVELGKLAAARARKRCAGCGQFMSVAQVAGWDRKLALYWHQQCAERLDDKRRAEP